MKPQPTYIESSGRWRWPIPIRKIQKGCYTSVVTASREWWEYLLPEQMPYQPGDLLYIREAIRAVELDAGLDCIEYQADFMPKEYARIWLEVTGVRVERVQEISEGDCWDEGIESWLEEDKNLSRYSDGTPNKYTNIKQAFAAMWDFINGKKPGCSWEDNPFVWTIEFRRIKP